ncbi:hypothetical protein RQP46_004768 [Phenoliferia psychrophenolica]
MLSQRGISTDPISAITGNIAVSPAPASYLTGFSLAHASGTPSGWSSQVNGSVYAADYGVPTPNNLTIATQDVITAYNDAMGRPNPDYFNLQTGNIGGLRMYPGLYKWTTDVYINNILRLSGGVNDTFIFQISGALTMSSSVQVVLLGGVKPQNVFWAVAGGIALGTTSKLQGIVSCKTKIFLDTKTTVIGRMYSQTAMAVYQSTITQTPTRAETNAQ